MTEQRRFSDHPLFQLTWVRILEFAREPEAVFWVFIFPVLLALALGIAFRSRPPEKAFIAVVDQGEVSQGILKMLDADSVFIRAEVLPPEEAARSLRVGKADLTIKMVIPDRLTDPPEPPAYDFKYDPNRPKSRVAMLLAENAIETGIGRQDRAAIREEVLNEPGARYIDFVIPGLIGLNLMGSGMWGVGFNVVNARTRKLLKRMVATPMRRSHFLMSFMLSRIVFLVLEVAALVVFGMLVFNVKIYGSAVSLMFFSFLAALTFAGMGLLVAARATSIEAVSGWMNFVMLPMWLLSGSFFSYESFPKFFHPFIKLLPLTAANDGLRLIMNDGASLLSTWPQILVVIGWGLMSFIVALKIFRWQ